MNANLRSEILRELVTEYKTELDDHVKNIIFEKILARVDKLLIKRVTELKRYRRQLSRIDMQDLYHTSIIGLHRAILSAKDHDSGDTVQARILSYVNEEVRKTYLGRKREMHTVDPSIITNCMLSYEHQHAVETTEIIEKLWKMVDDKIVDRNDVNMMIDNAVNGKSFSEIGRERGIHYTTVSNRIRKLRKFVLEKLGLDQY